MVGLSLWGAYCAVPRVMPPMHFRMVVEEDARETEVLGGRAVRSPADDIR